MANTDTNSNINQILESALNYAQCEGLRVFPVASNSKGKQLLTSWKKEATSDPEKVKEWFNHIPTPNLCIVGGKTSNGNNLLIIDIDSKQHNNKSGMVFFDQYQKENGEIKETYTVQTPTKGLHLYYYIDESHQYKNVTNLVGGIDLRGDGAYVVASPSVIDGKMYAPINDKLIEDADDTVYAFLEAITKPQGTNQENNVDASNKPTNALEMDTIPEGERDGALFKYASSMQAKGYTDNEIKTLLFNANSTKCDPPLSGYEVESIYNTVIGYPKGGKKKNDALSLDMTSLSDVEKKPIEWLIPDFIPKCGITLLSGDGGVGKTFVWCDLVASLSNGACPFFENKNLSWGEDRLPQKVMFFSSEDDIARVLANRLESMGANMGNIITITPDDDRFKEIKYNGELLGNLIEEYKPCLVVFDPLQGFIPDNVNMSQRNQMRNLLQPLIGLCDKNNMAIMIVCHTNKRDNAYGRNRVSDSSDIWDISRSVFIVGNTNENDYKYFSHEKSNYGALQETTLFQIVDNAVEWRGTTEKKDRDYTTSNSYDNKGKVPRKRAKECIIDCLKREGNSMLKRELEQMVKDYGNTSSSFTRAYDELVDEKKIVIEYTKNEGKQGKLAVVRLSIK